MNRVAFALADNGDHYHEFREILLDMRFMPAGRGPGRHGCGEKSYSVQLLRVFYHR